MTTSFLRAGKLDGREEPVLVIDRARLCGDAIAAVAALGEESGARALDTIQVEYEELP